MESTQKFTKRLQRDLQPRAAYAANHNMAPSHFYISSMLLSLVGGILVTAGSPLHWPMLLVCLILFARILCTNIALLLICEHRMTSHLNIFLAELHVAVSDALILLPFGFIEGVSGAIVVSTVVIGLLCQMASIIAVPIVSSRRHDGPINSTDRLIVFGLIALIIGVGIPPFLWVNVALLVLFALQFATLVEVFVDSR